MPAIPKSDGGCRLLALASALYRAWASSRLRPHESWQESWAPPGLHGARKGHSCTQVWYSLSSLIEHAHAFEYDTSGGVQDLQKCFDRIPQRLALDLLSHMGMNPAVVGALGALWSSTTRRLQHGAYVGAPFFACTGIPQGCSLSGLVCNAVLAVWLRAINAVPPRQSVRLEASSYADNISFCAAPIHVPQSAALDSVRERPPRSQAEPPRHAVERAH
eukprot:9886754-Heterocapsa_arctica.AAC.1